MLCLVLCFAISGCSDRNDAVDITSESSEGDIAEQTEESTPPEKDQDEDKPLDAITLIRSIQDTGISSGEIRLTGTSNSIYGHEYEEYEDDYYQYTVSIDIVIIVNGLNITPIENTNKKMSEAELAEYGKSFAKRFYSFMNWDSGMIDISTSPSLIDENDIVQQMSFLVEERSGNIFLSANSFEMTNNGTIVLFTWTQNDPGNFNFEGRLGEEEAKSIAFNEAMAHKEEWAEIRSEALFGETIDDFVFGRIELYLPYNNEIVAWSVSIKPKESWGNMNGIEDYALRISIDAETGEAISLDIIESVDN